MHRFPLRTATPRPVRSFCLALATVVAFGALGALGCWEASEPVPEPDPPTQCVDPRPQVCTPAHRPVCGVQADGTEETFENGCSACSDPAVVAHRPGEC